MDGFIIRLVLDNEIEQMMALMRACFGDREFLNQRWYKWFNFKCPTGKNRNYAAIDQTTGNFIGAYGLLPRKIKINADIYSGSLCTNVMTHPLYQGKSIFVKMGEYCLGEESKYKSRVSFGIPNEKAYKGHIKVGWKHLCNLRFIAKSSFKKKQYRAIKANQFDPRVNILINDIAKQTNLFVIKDHEFLNWRYVKRPDRTYKIFTYENNGKIEGYVVLKNFDDNGYKKTDILDILAYDQNIFNDLIAVAEDESVGRDELCCWQVNNSLYERYFLEAGFIEQSKKDPFIIHTNYNEEIIPIFSNWLFVLGDNDVF